MNGPRRRDEPVANSLNLSRTSNVRKFQGMLRLLVGGAGIYFAPGSKLESGGNLTVMPGTALGSFVLRVKEFDVSSSLSVVIVMCLFAGMACSEARAQASRPAGAKAAAGSKEAELKALARQLGAPKESDREEAKKKMQAAGLAAIEVLGDTAATGTNRAKENALEILKTHVEGTKEELRLPAFEELRRLSVASKSSIQVAAKTIVDEHKDLHEQWLAKRAEIREKRAANPTATPTPKPQPMPTASADPATQLRRQAIEQQLKDADAAIAKIKQLKLPKDLESQQISAVNLAVQKLRSQLKELDGAGKKKSAK